MIPRSGVPDGSEYDALIFDWDGTLVDSRQICFDGLARSMADVGAVLDPVWYWPRQAIASPDMLIIWEQDFGPLPRSIPEIIGRCREYVMAAAGELTIIEPIACVARAARERGQPLAIGSNASSNTVAAGLRATGLADLFDVVVTWSDVSVGRGKPEPDIFLLAADGLGIQPKDCLVYGDSALDVQAALAAGMTAYHVLTGEFVRPSTIHAQAACS